MYRQHYCPSESTLKIYKIFQRSGPVKDEKVAKYSRNGFYKKILIEFFVVEELKMSISRCSQVGLSKNPNMAYFPKGITNKNLIHSVDGISNIK